MKTFPSGKVGESLKEVEKLAPRERAFAHADLYKAIVLFYEEQILALEKQIEYLQGDVLLAELTRMRIEISNLAKKLDLPKGYSIADIEGYPPLTRGEIKENEPNQT